MKNIFTISVISVCSIFLLSACARDERMDAFAQCLGDKGAVFYGAFWCPHCQNQKKLFGKSQDLLPYVECSTPDGKEQLQSCKDQEITSYPTWRFADGSELRGEVSLEDLAAKTECQLL